ncbi:polymer-forming cytoskeletal protein [Leptospira wolffii]|uniref:Cell division protein n=1 Tax=Leptospira wolffii TaxID=409998 RepID=A0A2M9ZB75_9LEPT|nr:polymer-forming cytoskeletal protein [Leptospira wolffii]EPG67227.1 polymer-forming cytoskeletal family protein [Leptospira wolffii serovar Khorat str. Khorat-H2]PJZ65659.1 cell division protein [Leptospira wolffii]TGK56128.1 polymer-forming cytoskeletal protein [Leptospira wolffii]TGK72174.1 polymer-forming cytoskeletal protein [Leptospira wolffii]TGK77478.1 polymer-forming cytoskeletal protein [Leptospira wolffii]
MSKKTATAVKPNRTVTEYGTIATVLGKETSFSGILNFRKPLEISGEFQGEIESEGFLLVSEGAKVRANIKAGIVIVAGEITGNVIATQRLEMLPSGKVNGNIKTAKLQIADGVVFEGNCEMILPNKD